jgi:prohibitin 2
VAQNPAYIELRRLEAAVQIAGIMADSSSKLYLESDSLLLNIQKSGLNDLGPVKQR